MQKVSRSIFAGLLVIAGLTACGDKVTVAPNGSSTTQTPQVHSVTITPATVTLGAGQTVQLVATVNADAGLARTVTWTSTNTAIATVNSSGLVTASATGSGTVAITATSTADPTVSGAASIIVTPTTLATISIASINQGGLPANLNNVTGQLDVTLNVDQGTQTITALNLLVKSIATGVVDTVATYTFTTPNKAPVSATSAPITMSFNTAAFNDTTGAVKFLNGQYTIQAQAVVAGSAQSPVSSTMQYTVNNGDMVQLSIKGDTSATGPAAANSTLWQGGKVNVTVVPVLYSGLGLKSLTVTPDFQFTNTAPQTVATYPTTVSFAVGKDSLTKAGYQALVTSVYTNGQSGPSSWTNQINVDNEAPALPTLLQLSNAKGVVGQWIGAGYTFGNSTDYQTANGDPGHPWNPGVGLGAATFYAWPKASFTGLAGGVGEMASCSTTGGTLVTSSASLAQSAAADSTTYNLRVLQYDKLGNLVCQDLSKNFGVDVTPPIVVSNTATKDSVAANVTLVNTVKAYNTTEFSTDVLAAIDSVSGFNVGNQVTVSSSLLPSSGASACAIGTTANGCSATTGFSIPNTFWAPVNTEGYYTVALSVADRAGNSVAVGGPTVYAVDRTAPVGSGGVAIPAALVGGTSVSFTGTIKDNLTLMSGGGNVVYASGLIMNYDASSTFASAGTFGTLNQSGTATVNVPWLISDFQPGNGATDAIGSFNIRGTDEVGLSGSLNVAVPAANITTGAGTGHGTNGEWNGSDFTAFTETNVAQSVSIGSGGNPRSVALTANVTLPGLIGLPFSQICFYYQDVRAAMTAPNTFGPGEYKPTGQCVSTAATSDNLNWVYTSGAWTPPSTLALGALNIIAVGFGQNGHASYTAANATITLTN